MNKLLIIFVFSYLICEVIEGQQVTSPVLPIPSNSFSITNEKGIEVYRYKDIQTQLYYVITYNKGLIIGKYKVYFKYNKPIKKKIGDDVSITYMRADSILYETNFINGNGVWKDFYHNGNLKELGKYKLGKKDGEWSYYDINSFLYLKRYYENGIFIDSLKFELPQDGIMKIRMNE